MKYLAVIGCAVLTGCSSMATTEVTPATSQVKSKTKQKLATTSDTSKVTFTTPVEKPVVYKLKVKTCDTSSSSASQPSATPSQPN